MYGLVSVIMPNYNSEKFLPQTIESVLRQTYSNLELLIVDDCSTDNSITVVEEYQAKDNRVKLFKNEVNQGCAYTRNVALREAKGDWIAFLDSDDLWLPEKLERQLSFMVNNEYEFSYTKYNRVDENNIDLKEVISGPKVVTRRKIFRYCYIGCLTAMYKASAMGIIQVEEAIGNGRNDYALWLKAGKIRKCYLLDEVLSTYRLRKRSLSHGSFKKLLKYHYQLFRIGEKMGVIRASYYSCLNFFYGALKKIFYKKKVK